MSPFVDYDVYTNSFKNVYNIFNNKKKYLGTNHH